MTQDKDLKVDKLPLDWRYCADAAARNLGLSTPLNMLPAEHWLKVLTNVEMKMRLKGSVVPDGWQASLAEEVGRLDQ